MAAVPGSLQEQLNKSMPVAFDVKLGDTLADLIAAHNALATAFNVLVAKLNADAGVTDTNYATVSAQVGDLNSRKT